MRHAYGNANGDGRIYSDGNTYGSGFSYTYSNSGDSDANADVHGWRRYFARLNRRH